MVGLRLLRKAAQRAGKSLGAFSCQNAGQGLRESAAQSHALGSVSLRYVPPEEYEPRQGVSLLFISHFSIAKY